MAIKESLNTGSMMGSVMQYDQAFTSKMIERFSAEEKELDQLLQ
jgi:hypothetical protein